MMEQSLLPFPADALSVVKRPETVSFRAKREILQKKQVMNTVPSSLVVMIT